MKMRKRTRGVFFGLGIGAYLSGAGIFVFSSWIRVASVVGEQHHPGERWTRMIHTSVTYLLLVMLGYLIHSHVVPGLRARPKKKVFSGMAILGVFAFLTLSAMAIFYASEGDFGRFMSLGHTGVGLLAPSLVLLHVFLI